MPHHIFTIIKPVRFQISNCRSFFRKCFPYVFTLLYISDYYMFLIWCIGCRLIQIIELDTYKKCIKSVLVSSFYTRSTQLNIFWHTYGANHGRSNVYLRLKNYYNSDWKYWFKILPNCKYEKEYMCQQLCFWFALSIVCAIKGTLFNAKNDIFQVIFKTFQIFLLYINY